LVYGLYDFEGKLRYIGQTRQTLSERMRWFWRQIGQARGGGRKLTPVEAWLDECLLIGFPVEIKLINGNGTWNISEVIEIDRARSGGANLLNILRGGSDTIDDFRRIVPPRLPCLTEVKVI